jgi:hypothetical protein
MGRSESKKVVNQGMAQSATDQSNAQAALGKANSNLAKYSSNLDSFMRLGRKTYGANGEYMRDASTVANTTAAAGATSLKGDLALNAQRAGENTAGYADTVAESKRQSERDLTSGLVGADADRLKQLTAINQYGVQASALPAEIQAGLYGTSTSGSAGQLNPAANAAKTPGFFDTFLPALVGGAGAAAAGFRGGGGGNLTAGMDLGGAMPWNPTPAQLGIG